MAPDVLTESLPSLPPPRKRARITRASILEDLYALHLSPTSRSSANTFNALQSYAPPFPPSLRPPFTLHLELIIPIPNRPWQHNPPLQRLSSLAPTSSRTVLRFTREGLNGRVTGYKEVDVPRERAGAKSSSSFSRRAAGKAQFVRGGVGGVMFEMGGVEAVGEEGGLGLGEDEEGMGLEEGVRKDGGGGAGVEGLGRLIELRKEGGLLSVPPGFTRGLREDLLVKKDAREKEVEGLIEEKPADLVRAKSAGDGLAKIANGKAVEGQRTQNEDDDADLLLPIEFPSLAPRKALPTGKEMRPGKQWAHNIDVNRPFPNFRELVPSMAREWPFELDTFQKEAVYHLESGDSVFVAAHTSAGKTVVAEYAIALAAKHMTKAIYTSPIKALSNQKFRDFRTEFEDVGILTGDVQINPEASCLIMTTEILRSMLYRGADLIRDVEYVIFDEVHYVNDLERGVVWEEVIIMLPAHVTLILLSATVPNTFEFASWVGRTKRKDMYVISTPKRPVPLEHYLWGSKRLFKIVDAEKRFLEKGWKDASDALSGRDKIKAPAVADGNRAGGGVGAGRGARGAANQRGRGQPQRGGAGGGTFSRPGHAGIRNTAAQDKTLWVHLVQHLRREDLLPACVFVFSKKRCEENADALNNQDYTTATEKSAIHMIIEKSIVRLKPEDRTLPQILRIREILARGLAVHHGGLLPIVKELVEILFAQGLVKVLFATETFAMGLNLPTRTVVFSGYRKHDGHSFRDLLPGEYTQMAGRAGRRGLDEIGTVIIVAGGDEAPPAALLKTMILGTPTKLRSQFRLTYNMILSLLRVEALKIEEMIKRSFSENASQALLPRHEKDIKLSEADLERIRRPPCEVCDVDLEGCHEAAVEYEGATRALHLGLLSTPVGRRVLSARRLVVYRREGIRSVGILLRDGVSRNSPPSFQVLELGSTGLIAEPSDLLPFLPAFYPFIPALTTISSLADIRPLTIPLEDLERTTSTTMKTPLDALFARDPTALSTLLSELSPLKESWPSGPSWAEYDLSRLKAYTLHETLSTRTRSSATTQSAPSALSCPSFPTHFSLTHREFHLRASIAALRSKLSSQNLALLPDYEQRLAVLAELGFITAEVPHQVTLKGRVACEIRSADELVLAELVLENGLEGFGAEEVCALLSGFVFQERMEGEPVLSTRLEEGVKRILAVSERVGEVQARHQVVESGGGSSVMRDGGGSAVGAGSRLKFGLVEVVHAWASGREFREIMELTEVAEGTIVRVVGRLDECCREVKDAARILGDAELGKKMGECAGLLRRGVLGVASLYM